jgi:tetratricopeptide (TPR) repeat protein/DNA-binding XRE family transcriptional regulator
MPAKLGSRDDLGLALTFLRWLKDWHQEDLAAASGVSLDGIQAIERGRRRQPTLKTLGPIVKALGVDLGILEGMVALVRKMRGRSTGSLVGGASSVPKSGDQDSSALVAPRDAAIRAVSDMLHLAIDSDHRAPGRSTRQALQSQASALWQLVADVPPDILRRLVQHIGTFQTLEFSELLCERSLDAASDSARDASHLAELAVEVARRIEGAEGFRSRATGYAGVHWANGRRVAGGLPAADEAFESFLELWNAGAAEDPGRFNGARVLGLEASLRRAQRRLPEALDLIDRALAIDTWGETPALLLAKARALAEMGSFEASLASLRQALPQIEADREPRRRYVVCNLLVLNLCHLGRYSEADLHLSELRALALRLGNRLDLLRTDWLAAKVAAGQGRPDEAVATLVHVREQFLATDNAYDVALVSLELAEVHAALGHTGEVKSLARESAPLFADQGVHREAQRALALFSRAIDEERLTADLLHNLIAFLYRARHDPEIRFNPGPRRS